MTHQPGAPYLSAVRLAELVGEVLALDGEAYILPSRVTSNLVVYSRNHERLGWIDPAEEVFVRYPAEEETR